MTSPETPGQGEEIQPSFEDAYRRLGETVQALESGSLSLDAATKLYEEGMHLVQLCSRLLGDAELKVTQLQTSYSGYLARGTGDGLFDTEEDEEDAE